MSRHVLCGQNGVLINEEDLWRDRFCDCTSAKKSHNIKPPTPHSKVVFQPYATRQNSSSHSAGYEIVPAPLTKSLAFLAPTDIK